MPSSLKNFDSRQDFDKAVSLKSRGKLFAAKKILRSIAKRRPRSAAIIGYLAGLYFEEEAFETAAELFQRAVRLSLDSELASLGLFHSYIELGKDGLARRELRRFVARHFSRQYSDMLNDVNNEQLDDDQRPFSKTGPIGWRTVHRRLFPLSIPERADWGDTPSIVATLNAIGAFSDSNHVFIPQGGGADLQGASVAAETNCIELHLDNLIVIVQPKQVLFESFKLGPEWSYFRLETHELTPVESRSDPTALEELVEIDKGRYAPNAESNAITQGSRSWEPRKVMRSLSGNFVIFSKTSVFNRKDYYSGLHGDMTNAEFSDAYRKLLAAALKKLD